MKTNVGRILLVVLFLVNVTAVYSQGKQDTAYKAKVSDLERRISEIGKESLKLRREAEDNRLKSIDMEEEKKIRKKRAELGEKREILTKELFRLRQDEILCSDRSKAVLKRVQEAKTIRAATGIINNYTNSLKREALDKDPKLRAHEANRDINNIRCYNDSIDKIGLALRYAQEWADIKPIYGVDNKEGE